ncbi:uncharacterized protein LOC134909710 isoform X2 [Pseudophryne corroboree]|uniref:uncharacterized protein LOC134909710 isoform X2 n=1 Tax=Pseudophryne corroboree TaxID=495146 RepID=UPI003081D417
MGKWLDLYPNKRDAKFLFDGFKFGFRLPVASEVSVRAQRNLQSARALPTVLREKVDKEVRLGRMEGPFRSPPVDDLVISPVGVVPKKTPGVFRLIQHLSYPPGASVNDAIPPAHCSVVYQSFDEALEMVRSYGSGALMAKIDVESAFRLLPLHPDSFRFMGFLIGAEYFIDKCLPMGCSVSCSFFERFSTFLHWCVESASGGHGVAHYLDNSCVRVRLMTQGAATCCLASGLFFYHFGVPVAVDKTEGPDSCLSFLGIEIDTVAGECRLPRDKVSKLRETICWFNGSRKVTLRQAQSLLGMLNFACRVIPMGRVFCRKLERATAGCARPHHFVRLSSELKRDLAVWASFLEEFNGVSIWQAPAVDSEQLQLFTDAAGVSGFGCFLEGSWCAASWPANWHSKGLTKDLVLLELFPIMVALEVWGDRLANRSILFRCDNLGVVHAINNQRAKSLVVLRVLGQLLLTCLRRNLWFRAQHVPGLENGIADALSRGQWERFWVLAPEAEEQGFHCPGYVWQVIGPEWRV